MGFDMANSQQRIMVATQRCRKPGAGLLAWQPLVDVEVPIPKAAVVRVVTWYSTLVRTSERWPPA